MRPKFLGRSRNEADRIGVTPAIHRVLAVAIIALWIVAVAAGVLAWVSKS